jgi:hypothetical protein
MKRGSRYLTATILVFSIFLILSMPIVSAGLIDWVKNIFNPEDNKQLLSPNNVPEVGTIIPPENLFEINKEDTFYASYTDRDGATDLKYGYLIINTNMQNTPHKVWIEYRPDTDKFGLINDDEVMTHYCTPGSNQVIQNSYVKLNCATSTATGSGNTLTLKLALTFKQSFTGDYNMYLYAKDNAGTRTSWTDRGDLSIVEEVTPVVISFNSFNAPLSYAGGTCVQNPVLVKSDLTPGDTLKINNLNGNLCMRLYPRSGSCVNIAGSCRDGNIVQVLRTCEDEKAKIGFYNSANSLISEHLLEDFKTGVEIPENAIKAYVYFKEEHNGKYFDNNGAYSCSFDYEVIAKVTPTPTPTPTNRLIHHYSFEDNTNDQAGTNHGTNNGASFVDGKSGKALNFDGTNDYITLTNDINLGNAEWTTSAWVKTSKTYYQTILSNSLGGPVANLLGIYDKILYRHYDGSWKNELGDSIVNNGEWHLLTWVNKNDKKMDLYVDGELDKAGVNSEVTNTGPVDQIGKNWGTYYFKGIMDELKVWNYALTQTEIQTEFNRGGDEVTCTDSDGGLDYYVKGFLYDETEDVIFSETSQGSDVRIISETEAELEIEGEWISVELNGIYDLSIGKFKVVQIDESLEIVTIDYLEIPDGCQGTDTLFERACDTLGNPDYVYYDCPTGCQDGACIRSFHSADYNQDWKIDATEFNRVQAHWRAGEYHVDSSGSDGYAPGSGSHDGSFHSADYNNDWEIDNSEKLRVEVYWKDPLGYVINSEGFDGFAACSSCSNGCEGGACIGDVTYEINSLWDIDNNGTITDDTDGTLILRYLFGVTGYSLIEESIGTNAQRNTAESIIEYLNCLETNNILDVDGSGDSGALTDGILINRYFMNWAGQELIDEVVDPQGTRTSANEIISFLENPDGWIEGICGQLECNSGQIIGEVNNDGVITSEDANLIAQISVGLISTPNNICCVDVTQDGSISGLDASMVARIVQGTESSPGTCGIICTDSDIGEDYYAKGIGNLIEEHEDYCTPEETLLYEHSCNSKISKNNYFYVEINGVEYEIKYKGADQVTSISPKATFEVTEETNDILESILPDGTFSLNLAGEALNFVNLTSADSRDFDITLSDKEYLVKERYSACPHGCEEGACSIECDDVDFNSDNIVNQDDVDIFEDDYGRADCSTDNNYCEGQDVNKDGVVNQFDLALIIPCICNPSWECEMDSIVCPPSGVQVKTCIDNSACNNENKIEDIQCTPGECGGCISPDDRCIPYGFRFKSNDLNSYCDIDGKTKTQKTMDSEGKWASCQNNYECESNVCSSGECIEITKFKVLITKVLCKLGHLFSIENYQQCVTDRIGPNTVDDEQPQNAGPPSM